MEIINNNEGKKSIVRKFLKEKKRRFILGINKWSDSVLDLLEVEGIVEDFTDKKEYRGYKIFRSHELPGDAMVLLSVFVSPQTVKKRMDRLGLESLDYFSFYKHSCIDVLPPDHMEGFGDYFEKNKDGFNWVYDRLGDEKSRYIFDKILNFKKTFDLDYMEGFVTDNKLQYFEYCDFFSSPNIVFVDGGGFRGETTIEFSKHFKGYDKVYFFEPSVENFSQAKHNLSKLDNVLFFQRGLYKEESILKFDHEKSSFCLKERVKDGDNGVSVSALDNVIEDRVDFIKMDIEGAEKDAIKGAQNLIREYTPFMAICVYHKHGDLFEIPQAVFEINDGYDIYLRHYSEAVTETVMYFIPKRT